MTERVRIKRLASGVPGLDAILGGGLPEYSFNLIAGSPGSGKTTMAHQIMFANASPEQPALYVSVLGEPPLKMLRYQQQYSFFDAAKLQSSVRFLHLGNEVLASGLETVLARIVREVEDTNPKLVFVDSFRSVVRKSTEAGQMELQNFVQRLSLQLTGWEATTFLIGEYEEGEAGCNPVFTVADGILWLSQPVSRGASVRKLQVMKMRGQAPIAGDHTLKITDAGITVYPRLGEVAPRPAIERADDEPRRSTGIAGLDDMLGGGIPAGYSILVAGPSGSGKTILATEFIRSGIERGEPGLIAVFDKRPDDYLRTTPNGHQLAPLVGRGSLGLLHLRPLDLSVEETIEAIGNAVAAIGAKRLVIDSLSGFELAVAPLYREDFRESLYRVVGGLVQLGVTVMMTAEIAESYGELQLGPHGASLLADGIIVQRYVELDGTLARLMFVAKMRGLRHSSDLKQYEIGATGITVGGRLTGYTGLLAGRAQRTDADD